MFSVFSFDIFSVAHVLSALFKLNTFYLFKLYRKYFNDTYLFYIFVLDRDNYLVPVWTFDVFLAVHFLSAL